MRETAIELRRLLTNPALLVGLLALLGLLAMGAFGSLLVPYDPNAGTSMLIRELPNGNLAFKVPPSLPDENHLFGTDTLGRDQWSRVLAGARITLTVVLAATIVRLALGFVIGLTTGWYGGPLARVIRTLSAGVTAIPQLLLAIILVLVTRPLGPGGFVLALALVGWPEISEIVRAGATRIKAQPYMEAARAVGSPGRRLITGHLVTAMGPQLLTLAALESGAVLLLLAELGILGLFLAGASVLVGDFGPFAVKERAPEWGQMLGAIQFVAMTEQLSTLIPALFIVVASATLALLADGLRAASDPFSPSRVLPGTFGVLSKVLAGALCFSAVGFVAFNVPTRPLTLDEGRDVAARTAALTWPGSAFVAGVARFTEAHGLERPERLSYYFRNTRTNELMRITFANADALSVDVRKFEEEDGIDFNGLNTLPSRLLSYDVPIEATEVSGVGESFRAEHPNYVIRAILSWPAGSGVPIYDVVYGATGHDQLNLSHDCCFDARTGNRVSE
jgi:peptide/nickel transport system permease protein